MCEYLQELAEGLMVPGWKCMWCIHEPVKFVLIRMPKDSLMSVNLSFMTVLSITCNGVLPSFTHLHPWPISLLATRRKNCWFNILFHIVYKMCTSVTVFFSFFFFSPLLFSFFFLMRIWTQLKKRRSTTFIALEWQRISLKSFFFFFFLIFCSWILLDKKHFSG